MKKDEKRNLSKMQEDIRMTDGHVPFGSTITNYPLISSATFSFAFASFYFSLLFFTSLLFDEEQVARRST